MPLVGAGPHFRTFGRTLSRWGVLAGGRPGASAMEPILWAWIQTVACGAGESTMSAGIRL